MKHLLRMFVVGGLVFTASGGAAVAAPTGGSTESARVNRVENGLRPRVLIEGEPRWTLRDRMEHYRVPGVSVAVFHDFRLAWAKGYGVREAGSRQPITSRTLLQAASIGKPITAAAVLGLVEAGRLSLDADVNTSLRSWRLPENAWTRTRAVTPRRLLSHSAGVTVHGFPGYASGDPTPTLLQVLTGQPPANTDPVGVDQEPGLKFRYSGGGYLILQQVIEDVSHRSYGSFVAEQVLTPLGMANSAFGMPPTASSDHELASGHRPDGSVFPGRYHAYPELGCGAGLWTTPTDLARFALAVQQARDEQGGGAMLKATATLMTTKVTDQTGLGFFFTKDRYFTHGGANEGFVGQLVGHLDQGYGAVILTNSDNGGPLVDEIIGAIAAEYGWENWQPDAPVRAVHAAPRALDRYAGRYQLGTDMIVQVTKAGDMLRAIPSFGEPFDLIPIAPDTFVRRDNPTRYRFTSDGATLERLSPAGQLWGRDARVTSSAAVPLQYVEEGNIPAATVAYRRLRSVALSDDPTGSEEDLTDWGYQLLGRLDFRRAASMLEVASALYPSSVKIWFGLGEARLWAGQVQEAKPAFRRALLSAGADRVTPPDIRQMLVSEASSRLREIARRRGPVAKGKRRIAE